MSQTISNTRKKEKKEGKKKEVGRGRNKKRKEKCAMSNNLATEIFQQVLPNLLKHFKTTKTAKHNSLHRHQLCHVILPDFTL